MIKLSEISTENTEKFLEDTHRRMYDMLSDSERDASYGRIIHYCSTEGHLDNEKIRRLLIGNISDLRDAIVNIGPIEDENVNVKRKFKGRPQKIAGQLNVLKSNLWERIGNKA